MSDWRTAATPGTAHVADPRPGNRVLFKYRREWTLGEIAALGDLRVRVKRPGFKGLYWRNRSQIRSTGPRAEP